MQLKSLVPMPYRIAGAAFMALALVLWVWRLDSLRAHYKAELSYITFKVKAMNDVANETDKRWRLLENTWKVKHTAIDEEKKHEVEAIQRKLDTAIAELQSRPTRASAAASTAKGATDSKGTGGCTGAQLFRDDAEFLTREAAAADNVVAELKACYAHYDTNVE